VAIIHYQEEKKNNKEKKQTKEFKKKIKNKKLMNLQILEKLGVLG
jgi:hypothetical protein